MRKSLLVLVSVVPIAIAGTVTAIAVTSSSFLSAPAGVALSFQTLTLPPVAANPEEPLEPWSPSVAEVLQGETVVTSQDQARDVWKRIFRSAFNPALVDFDQSFLILMGGGMLSIEDFQITAVEEVDASWSEFFGGIENDAFLAVTGTTVIPGVFPQDPPKPSWRVAAVVVSRDFLDDVVFHRTVLALP